MDENLIGYLLNALDDSERIAVEAHLSQHPEDRNRLETLRRALTPLEADAGPPEPPRHLALATLARIAELQCRTLPEAPPPRRTLGPWRGLRRADVVAAAVLLLFLGGLSVPWVLQQWHTFRIQACKNNLAQFWQAMQLYSQRNGDEFPQIPEHGPQSFAGMFVPMLHNNGVLSAENHLVCDQSDAHREAPATVQELEDLRHHPDQVLFQRRARHLAGNYAYPLGYRENGVLKGPRRTDNSYHPLLADHRPDTAGLANSPNHGGGGQNVLHVGGDVRWSTLPTLNHCGGDNIYLNRDHKVLAGIDANDTVLGSGDASPSPRDD